MKMELKYQKLFPTFINNDRVFFVFFHEEMENKTIEELIEFCTQENIPVSSSRNLLLANIYHALNERTGESFPLVPEDPRARNVALEVGVNPNLSSLEYSKFCSKIGSPHKYIESPGLTAVVFPIYDKRAELDPTLYYPKLQRNLYSMSNENFISLMSKDCGIHRDDTIREFILTHSSDAYETPFPKFDDKLIYNTVCVLHYQTLDDLKNFASNMPDKSFYFETEAGCIDHILSQLTPEIANEIIRQCTEKYLTEERKPIYEKVLSNSNFTTHIPSPLPYPYCFAIPPNKFEQEWFRECNSGIGGAYHRAAIKFGVHVYHKNAILNSHFVNKDYLPYVGDKFDCRLKIISIVKDNLKEIRFMTDDTIKSLMGYDGIPFITRHDLLINIKRIIDSGNHFELLTNPDYCRNDKDVYFSSLREVISEGRGCIIGFGNYKDKLTGYTIEELITAFGYNNGMIAQPPIYTIPDKPTDQFGDEEISELIELGSIFSEMYPQYANFFETLKIVFTVSSNLFIKELINNSEKDKFIEIFKLLFYAGMAKRGWKGWETKMIDNVEVKVLSPYPMSAEETRKAKITEYLYDVSKYIVDAYAIIETLSAANKKLFNELSTYKFKDREFIAQTKLLGPLFRTVYSGDHNDIDACTALASEIFIVTGYTYLRLIGVTIPDFDITKFTYSGAVHHNH